MKNVEINPSDNRWLEDAVKDKHNDPPHKKGFRIHIPVSKILNFFLKRRRKK